MTSDLSNVPVFGSRVEGRPCIVRPSAYAVARDPMGRIAVVRTKAGYFLPGGGIESGENPEQAAARETLEECGLVLGSYRRLGAAIEIVHSAKEDACFEKRSTFFEAGVQGTASASEPDHELLWLTLEEAIELLSHGSHRWAVRQLETTS